MPRVTGKSTTQPVTCGMKTDSRRLSRSASGFPRIVVRRVAYRETCGQRLSRGRGRAVSILFKEEMRCLCYPGRSTRKLSSRTTFVSGCSKFAAIECDGESWPLSKSASSVSRCRPGGRRYSKKTARWLSVLESDGRHFQIPLGSRAAALETRHQWSSAVSSLLKNVAKTPRPRFPVAIRSNEASELRFSTGY